MEGGRKNTIRLVTKEGGREHKVDKAAKIGS